MFSVGRERVFAGGGEKSSLGPRVVPSGAAFGRAAVAAGAWHRYVQGVLV